MSVSLFHPLLARCLMQLGFDPVLISSSFAATSSPLDAMGAS
jgi:hypothetical protein